MNAKLLIVILFVGILGVGLGWLARGEWGSEKERVVITNFEECVAAGNPVMDSYPQQCRSNGEFFVEEIEDEAELVHEDVRLFEPKTGEVITSPLMVRGEARGTWFFEADFPMVLVNWDGLIIAEGIATAVLDPEDLESTWMTEDFVPFEGELEFEDSSWDAEFSQRGWLILHKDNPSGLPEHDDAVEVEVGF